VELESVVGAVAVGGSTACLTSGFFKSLDIVDLTEPTRPERVGGLALQEWLHDVAVVGSHALVGGAGALHLVGISNPAQPSLTNSDADFEGAEEILVGRGSFAYLLAHGNSMQQVDASDVDSLDAGAFIDSGTGTLLFDVVPGTTSDTVYAFGFDRNDQLDVYSVTDGSAAPSLLGSHVLDPPPFQLGGVAVGGGTAFVVANRFGQPVALRALDVGTPASITEIGSLEIEGLGRVRAAGNLVVVLDWGFGVRFFDVSDPTDMKPAGGAMTLGAAVDFEIVGDLVVLATEFGLEVVGLPVREVP
jgi:hypothetical protein